MVRFVVVGVVNTANYTLTYWLLLHLDIPYVAASILAYALAISIAYFLNHRYTFRVAEHVPHVVARFFAVQVGGAIINIIALSVMVEGWHWDPLIAQLILMPPVVGTTFLLNRLVVFHRHVDSRLQTPQA